MGFKILGYTDTRDILEVGEKSIRVPEKGQEAHKCERCGREHFKEFYCKDENGTIFTVGSGCILKLLAGSDPKKIVRVQWLVKKYEQREQRKNAAVILKIWNANLRNVRSRLRAYREGDWLPSDLYRAKFHRAERWPESTKGKRISDWLYRNSWRKP